MKKFIDEIYSKGPKEDYITNKIDVYHFDDIWSLDILDRKVYGPQNFRGYRFVLVVVDKFSKFGWTVSHKKNCSNNERHLLKSFLYIQNVNQS